MKLFTLLLFASAWLGMVPATVAASVTAVDLKSDYRVNPLGIDRLPPMLSWRIEAAGRVGAAQTAYQISAAKSEADLRAGKTTWNSGWVKSDRSQQIPYAGPAAKAGERVWWQVKIQDETAMESAWSPPAWFEAGLLDESGWKDAQWISDTRDFTAPEPAPAELMGPWIGAADQSPVSSFVVDVTLPDKPVVSARIWKGLTKSAGTAQVFVNADQRSEFDLSAMERVGARRVGCTDMAFYLKPGATNRIEVRLRKPAATAAITVGMRIAFADGSEMTVGSGKNWRVLTSKEKSVEVGIVDTYGGPTCGLAYAYPETNLAPAWFREPVMVKPGLLRARLYLCALGQGLAYVNGQAVDEVFFSSPQSDYEEFGYYTVHDIAAQLKVGTNALSVLLDGGWYREVGGFGTIFSYGRPGLRALVQLDYADGTTQQLTSGPDWQWKEGATRMTNIYRGEEIDYRLDHAEWQQAGAGAGWQQTQVIPPCTPKTVAMDVNPVRRDGTLTPVKSWQTGTQTWLFDLGVMTHGVARLKFNEASGKTIRLRYSEYAEKGVIENVPLSHWWCHGVMQNDQIIADGKPHTYESLFATKSFRFVEVSGLTKAPQPGDLVGIPVHTEAAVLTTFTSSDPMLNRLYQNGIRTCQNYVNHFSGDIPRERCLWGAESIYSVIPATYCFDWAPNHRLMNTLWWTGVMTKDGVPGNIGVGKRITTSTSSFIWSATPMFDTSEMLEFYGDAEPLRTYYDKARHFVLFYEKNAVNGAIPVPNQLSDHAAPKDIKRGILDGELVNAMVFFEVENRFARMADAMGKKADAEHARKQAEVIRAGVMARYDPAKHTFGNGTHDSLALAYGLITDPAEEKALAASLVGWYRANGHQFDGGFMSYNIYPMLAKYGYVEDAWQMLVNPDYPGPAWSVKTYDATSYWEVYWLDREMQMKVGQNFWAYAHPTGWMITDLAGIRYAPGVPNGKEMLLAPQVPPSGKLSQVTASLKTPTGMVQSAWTYQNESFKWDFTIPANATAEVRVPADAAAAVQGAEAMKPLRTEDGCVIYQASAGSYQVSSHLRHVDPPAPPPATPAAAIANGNETEWKASVGSSIKAAVGVITLTRGEVPTLMLTTHLPAFPAGDVKLTFRMKTPASGKAMVRIVEKQDRKNIPHTVEIDLAAPNMWNVYTIPLPAIEGKPFSLWIGLVKAQEELQFSDIRLEAGESLLKTWNF